MKAILVAVTALALVVWTSPSVGAQEEFAAATVHDAAESVVDIIGAAGGSVGGVDNPDWGDHQGGSPVGGLYGTFGFGTGVGTTTLSEGGLTNSETYLDWGGLHFLEGGMQSGGLRMGLGWTGWGEYGGEGAVRMNQFDFLLTMFPLRTHGLFVKAGVGLGVVRDAPLDGERTSYLGLSGRIGVGWEFLAWGPLRLAVESDLVGVSYRPHWEHDLTLEVSAVLLAVSLTWYQ